MPTTPQTTTTTTPQTTTTTSSALKVKTHIKAGLAMNYMRKSGE